MQFGKLKGCFTAMALMVGFGACLAHAEAPPSSSGTAIAIMQATAALQSNDCAGAMAPLNQLWNDPYLDGSDPDTAAQFRFALVSCTAQTQGLKAALALSTDNIKRAHTNVAAYDMHVFLQLLNQQPDLAALTLQDALARFKKEAVNLTDVSVMGVLLQEHDKDPVRSLALLNAMEEDNWQPHRMAGRPLIGLLRLEGLRKTLISSDRVHADLYRADIAKDSLIYIVSQGDAEISSPDGPVLPIKPIIASEIEAVKASVAADPTDLLNLSYLISLERVNGQDQLASTQLEGILALVDKYGLQNFQDQEVYGELLSDRAELLAAQGLNVQALGAYVDGATKLKGQNSGDFYLSYQNYLIDSGQEIKGLALEQSMDLGALDVGQKLTLAMNEACAYGYMKNDVQFAASLKQLDGNDILKIKPYLCASKGDSAAASLKASIAERSNRDGMISQMQDSLPALSYGARDDQYVAAYLALKKQGDVEVAAKAANITVRSWPLRF